jgi:hypothetical protein
MLVDTRNNLLWKFRSGRVLAKDDSAIFARQKHEVTPLGIRQRALRFYLMDCIGRAIQNGYKGHS